MVLQKRQFSEHVSIFGHVINLSNDAMRMAGISIDPTGTKVDIGERRRPLIHAGIGEHTTDLDLGSSVPLGDTHIKLGHRAFGQQGVAEVTGPGLHAARWHFDPKFAYLFPNGQKSARRMLTRGIVTPDEARLHSVGRGGFIQDTPELFEEVEDRFNRKNVKHSFSKIFSESDPETYQAMVKNRSNMSKQYEESIKNKGYVTRHAHAVVGGFPTSAQLRPHAGGWVLDEDQPSWKVR